MAQMTSELKKASILIGLKLQWFSKHTVIGATLSHSVLQSKISPPYKTWVRLQKEREK